MKINVAELLKDCPEGMELDCLMYDNVTLESVCEHDVAFPITIRYDNRKTFVVTKYGQYDNTKNAKCIIFPKGKTTWERFVPPCKFKDGDILTNERGSICIYKGTMYYSQNLADFYCGYRISDNAFILKKFKDNHFGNVNELRLASEIEKQHFFQILSNNGYRWNSEKKTLEKSIKPMFKIGDKIKLKNSTSNLISTVTKINDDGSICVNDYTWVIKYELQDKYELIPNKFDINTLIPFESRVLVRDDGYSLWQPSVWGLYDKGDRFPYITIGCRYRQCIPYEGNEHLLGTANNCDEYYKNW